MSKKSETQLTIERLKAQRAGLDLAIAALEETQAKKARKPAVTSAAGDGQ